MIEYDESVHGELSLDSDLGVKVIGVGGAGANVLDRMALEGSDVAELLALNTDVRALKNSVSSEKIQLGSTLLKGMGTGGDPDLGKQAALEAVDGIREAVRGAGMVFVCVGLGGGTGSGAAPEVCRIAKEEGVFLVVFATMPFSFEGQRRTDQADSAIAAIGRYADAVISFDNDRMGELIVPKDGVTQAFAAADKIISQSIRATMNIVFRPGIIHIGMDDLLTAIHSSDSRCLFGYGVSKGDNRSHEAVEQALKCPLLDRGKLLNDAKAVLVQVSGGENMTLFEVQMVMEEVA
ncbi:MAG: cell division protein FtsZ, partial [Verrucomicrobiota bacterium]